jgi:hypothetical protein
LTASLTCIKNCKAFFRRVWVAAVLPKSFIVVSAISGAIANWAVLMYFDLTRAGGSTDLDSNTPFFTRVVATLRQSTLEK